MLQRTVTFCSDADAIIEVDSNLSSQSPKSLHNHHLHPTTTRYSTTTSSFAALVTSTINSTPYPTLPSRRKIPKLKVWATIALLGKRIGKAFSEREHEFDLARQQLRRIEGLFDAEGGSFQDLRDLLHEGPPGQGKVERKGTAEEETKKKDETLKRSGSGKGRNVLQRKSSAKRRKDAASSEGLERKPSLKGKGKEKEVLSPPEAFRETPTDSRRSSRAGPRLEPRMEPKPEVRVEPGL
ncbi:hypothetical protein BJ508DRAFT_28930 [Ascobolus immersus RN42]|uniref:Uncharacterized protein n=1 Tax=Ascobolus immersus RN42 TaxID=1160509 RepID=A0A3N4HQV4_ASCIM|nr:hypothetical protein BJ508DRAFT_28930 [Ascobolus immersus RN42]